MKVFSNAWQVSRYTCWLGVQQVVSKQSHYLKPHDLDSTQASLKKTGKCSNPELLLTVLRNSYECFDLINVDVGVVQVNPKAFFFIALSNGDCFWVLVSNFCHPWKTLSCYFLKLLTKRLLFVEIETLTLSFLCCHAIYYKSNCPELFWAFIKINLKSWYKLQNTNFALWVKFSKFVYSPVWKSQKTSNWGNPTPLPSGSMVYLPDSVTPESK